MTTICAIVQNAQKSINVINSIIDDFPCFVIKKEIKKSLVEINLKCRKEDATAIQGRIVGLV